MKKLLQEKKQNGQTLYSFIQEVGEARFFGHFFIELARKDIKSFTRNIELADNPTMGELTKDIHEDISNNNYEEALEKVAFSNNKK